MKYKRNINYEFDNKVLEKVSYFLLSFCIIVFVLYIILLFKNGFINLSGQIEVKLLEPLSAPLSAIGSILLISTILLNFVAIKIQKDDLAITKQEVKAQTEVFKLQNFQMLYYRFLEHFVNIINKEFVRGIRNKPGQTRSMFYNEIQFINYLCTLNNDYGPTKDFETAKDELLPLMNKLSGEYNDDIREYFSELTPEMLLHIEEHLGKIIDIIFTKNSLWMKILTYAEKAKFLVNAQFPFESDSENYFYFLDLFYSILKTETILLLLLYYVHYELDENRVVFIEHMITEHLIYTMSDYSGIGNHLTLFLVHNDNT